MHWFRRSGTDTQLSGAGLSVTALRYFYILSAVLFILGLKGLSSPKYARRGMFLAAFGMLMAIVGTLFHPEIVNYRWITIGLTIGSIVGGSMGLRIPMTAVPQRTALSHSLGALAASQIGISEYVRHAAVGLDSVKMTTIGLQVIIVSLTFGIPRAIFLEATLSYLGVGIPPPTPSWGIMIQDGYQAIFAYPHQVLVPALALAVTMLSFSFIGDGLRDAIDPRMRR